MKKKVISIAMVVVLVISVCCLFACCAESSSENTNTQTAMKSSSTIIDDQPAPTDLSYSLERYNVIKKAYWVNGQREKLYRCPAKLKNHSDILFYFQAMVLW